jgi:hypothetical protein
MAGNAGEIPGKGFRVWKCGLAGILWKRELCASLCLKINCLSMEWTIKNEFPVR